MAPTLVREPFDRDGWVFEEKVDGWRSGQRNVVIQSATARPISCGESSWTK